MLPARTRLILGPKQQLCAPPSNDYGAERFAGQVQSVAGMPKRYYNKVARASRKGGFIVKMEKDIDIKEIQKDLSDYLNKKYGRRIQFAGFGAVPEPAEKPPEEEKETPGGIGDIHFDMKPEELKAYLDEYMVKQDAAKEVLED